MAECSYARCVQQRRNIRRELQRWTRNMVHIVGLERIAEELMGRRKWKLYQESMSRSYLQPLNNNIKTRTNQEELLLYKDQQQQQHQQQVQDSPNEHGEQNEEKQRLRDIDKDKLLSLTRDENGKEEAEQQKENNTIEKTQQQQELIEDRLKDWTPETKCYFCVDGKLDSEHTAHGVLSPRQSDSESSDSHSDNDIPPSLTPSATGLLNNNNNNTNNNNHYRHHPHPHHHPSHHHQQLQQLHHRSSLNIHPVAPVNMTAMESVTSMAAIAAAFSGVNSQGTPAPPLYYTPSMLTHNWYLANVAKQFQQTDRLTPSTAASANDTDKNTGGEQPLDLSKGAAANNNNSIIAAVNTPSMVNANNNMRLPTLDTKQIFNSDSRAKPRMSAVASRRTYTEDELQAALKDIQSGKLGTRRAAVIYGIPRSTLRNKVYKLALERERESHLNTSTPLKLDEEEAMDDDKELSGAEEEKEVEKALQAPLCDILRFSNTDIPPEVLKTLLQRTKDGHETWGGLEHSEVGPYIHRLLLASQNLSAATAAATNQKTTLVDNPVLTNVIPEFFKKIVEDQLKLQQHNNGENEKLMRPSPSNSVTSKSDRLRSESDMETDESPSNVILKIPSFKPTSSKNGCDLYRNQLETNSMVSPPVTSESGSPPILPGKGMSIKDVKEVIAQSISQKFQQNLEPARRPTLEMDFKRGGFTPPLAGGISVIKTQQDIGRSAYQPPNKPHTQQQQNTSAGSATGGKGTRPKRGKYRNYDRDSLVEAVRAVQRGEMSVHRAGSYYGVPHSTLEYKVKERHLMRPRKRDPKPNPVDEKIASLKQNDIRNSQDKLKPAGSSSMKPPQKYPPTSPNGMKLPMFNEPGMAPIAGYNHAPFPFWPHPSYHIPLDFARNPTAPFPPSPEFFASQMMQKIQEESSRTSSTSGGGGGGSTSNKSVSSGGGGGALSSTTPTLANSARQIAESLLDGTGSNGSFLDGIIRSSLEQGVPTPEEKSPKEDKNVAPENMSNKALLDQLCRNSRLTPLTKPLTEPNSSGDESYRKEMSPINFASAASNSKDSHHHQMDDSPLRFERSESTSDLPTIELSNDSNDSSTGILKANNSKRTTTTTKENETAAVATSPSPAPTTPTRAALSPPIATQQSPPQQQQQPPPAPPARIYLKKDLANPDNLQPEMLMRFRDLVPDTERNGITEGITGSASDNDAPQD